MNFTRTTLLPLAVATALYVGIGGCSTDFQPRECATDADCGGSELVCAEGAAPRICALAKDTPIRIGMAAPASGPSQDLGVEMKRGIDLVFAAQNANGGVRGRPLQLVFRDDEYEATRAEEAARILCDAKEDVGVAPKCPTTLTPPAGGQPVSQSSLSRGPNAVLAVLGNVGTPTMVRFAPIAVETGTLFFGAFTGAMPLLRDTAAGTCARYVFNVRASYFNEARATLEFFRQRGVPDYRNLISFDQNDAFGQAGYDGLNQAYHDLIGPLEGGAQIARFRYTRNEQASVPAAVEGAIGYLQGLLAQGTAHHTVGIMMTDTYGPGAQFIQNLRQWQLADQTRKDRLTLVFSNLSFVGPNSLADRLKTAGMLTGAAGSMHATTDVYVSQVVPNYADDTSDTVREYLAAIEGIRAQPTFTSLEGFMAAKVFVGGLLAHEGDFTPDALIPTFEKLPELNLGLGASAGFSAESHNYSRTIWGTSIREDGSFSRVYYWAEGTPIRFFE